MTKSYNNLLKKNNNKGTFFIFNSCTKFLMKLKLRQTLIQTKQIG